MLAPKGLRLTVSFVYILYRPKPILLPHGYITIVIIERAVKSSMVNMTCGEAPST